jgi:hypothetical protein
MGGGWRAARRVAGWGTVNAHTDDRTSVGEANRVGEGAGGGELADLDQLVTEWLTLPDVAELLGLDIGKVRRLLQDRDLLATRRGERNVLSVPAALVLDGAPLPELRGTLTVLADSGYDADAAMRWLFTPDDSLPGTPVDALRAGRKTEVRRRAQALAF